MRLAHAGGGDLHEAGVAAHLGDAAAAGVAHAGAQAADHLVDDRRHRALEGHAAFDAFRHELLDFARGVLEVAVLAALGHRTQRAHAAIALVATALEQLDLARGFLGAGEHAAHHHGGGTGGNGFCKVTGVAHAAIADERDAVLQGVGDIHDGRNLRHAYAGDDARGADRAGTNPHLDGIGTRIGKRQRGLGGGDVAADDLQFIAILLLDRRDAIQNALAVAVGSVDHHHIHARIHQRSHALVGVRPRAHSRAHAQATTLVLAGIGMVGGLLHVLDGDQPAQLEGIVHHQHFLDAVLVQLADHLVLARAFTHRDEAFLGRHHAADGRIKTGLEAQIAAGDDADELAVVHHRHAGDALRTGQRQHLGNGHGRGDRDRFEDDAALVLLHCHDLGGLARGSHVLVDDAQAAFLRQRDGEAGFGDGIHRCTEQRNVEADALRQLGGGVDLTRQDV